ncbi:MAG: response regulator [Polyangiaceae bacterium]|nr:response regulator [Polyangiaceae bacterium]
MDQQPINILLVDDEPRNLDALEVTLAAPGYRLIRALSGAAALSALLEHDIAAMVLDIRMPDVNGVELARIIKGTKRFREIPILFLTAHLLDEQDIVAGYGAGAADYLTKPVNPLVFRHKIAVFAELFRKTRALAELNETLEARVRERTAELERSEAALRAADRQKDEFLATLAHELRNPLAPLRMGLALLMGEKPSPASSTLTIMNRQLDHMVRLIDDLLDVARISGGNLELKKSRVSVAEAIQTALETCRPFFEQRRQVVSAEADESLFAFADPTRLAQIVSNLLHNACKFTPEEGRVQITLTHENSHAVIRVQDSGVGILADQLGRVFEMFTRIESPAQNGGLGIGLALSKRLAALHDGDISVSSEGAGKGSVFTFSLPAQVGETVSEADVVAPQAPPKSDRLVKLLVIEDNEDSAEMLAQVLESRGYAPSVAHTGTAGLALFQAERPRIVLCDIGLPDMDGLEVCKRVRASPLDYTPVMIALTGWGMQKDVRRTKDAGFDYHLVKPVAPENLFRLLDQLTDATLGQSASPLGSP